MSIALAQKLEFLDRAPRIMSPEIRTKFVLVAKIWVIRSAITPYKRLDKPLVVKAVSVGGHIHCV